MPSNKQTLGISAKAAARALGIAEKNFYEYEKKGWIVRFPDKSVDLDATMRRVDELRNPIRGGKPDRGPEPKPLLSGAPAPVAARASAQEADFADMEVPNKVVTLSEALRRDKLASALKKELEVARLRGDLIPRDMAEAVFCDVMAKVKANVEAIPNRTAPLLLGLSDVLEIRRVLGAAVEDALSAVSTEAPEVRE